MGRECLAFRHGIKQAAKYTPKKLVADSIKHSAQTQLTALSSALNRLVKRMQVAQCYKLQLDKF
jgi:hypothetical protein